MSSICTYEYIYIYQAKFQKGCSEVWNMYCWEFMYTSALYFMGKISSLFYFSNISTYMHEVLRKDIY